MGSFNSQNAKKKAFCELFALTFCCDSKLNQSCTVLLGKLPDCVNGVHQLWPLGYRHVLIEAGGREFTFCRVHSLEAGEEQTPLRGFP